MNALGKRIFSLIICGVLVLSLFGCHEEPGDTTPADTQPGTTQVAQPDPTDGSTAPQETNPTQAAEPPVIYPDLVGIYIPAADGTRARKHITEFSAKRTKKTDIDCFEIFACTQDRVMGSSFAEMWENAWNSHGRNPHAKIGFYIEFQLKSGETVSKTLLRPSDSQEFYDYLEIYMYDDVHQSGGWYTHLEDDDMDDETIITSIKLTSGSKIKEVGDIYLTAFIYNGENCFDSRGNYIGTVSQTIVITE